MSSGFEYRRIGTFSIPQFSIMDVAYMTKDLANCMCEYRDGLITKVAILMQPHPNVLLQNTQLTNGYENPFAK